MNKREKERERERESKRYTLYSESRLLPLLEDGRFCWDNPITFYLSVIAVRDLLFKQERYNIIRWAYITFGVKSKIV